VSDLQCPATLVLAAAGDEEQARALAESLRDRRVAVVYTDDSPATGAAVDAVSAGLGAPVRSEPDLREGFLPPGAVLEQLADAHRGETVLVLAAAPVLTAAVGELPVGAGRSYAARQPLAPGQRAELRADADGWVVDSWAGERPPH
jgi:2,3-bisphosphoglycerate-dependent phosphoglycerate mutase